MNTSQPILCVFNHTSWVAADFKKGVEQSNMDYQVLHSFGLDIPHEIIDAVKHAQTVSYWMPAAFAARLQYSEHEMKLLAPRKDFLSQIPIKLTHRKVITETLQNFIAHGPNHQIFAKPAEMKLDFFPAQTYTKQEIVDLSIQHNLPSNTCIQYTEEIMSINYEHRLYILDGNVMTGSAYVIDNEIYYDHMDDATFQRKLPEAVAYAQEIIPQINNQPSAFVLDVAWNENTEEWFVLEANPAWCSGIYGSDVEYVIQTIERSCNPLPEDESYIWVAEEFLIQRAEKQQRLVIF